ncbi:MAG: hypothetical protein LUF04_01990 [Bacteroides sp.]|nr:hypothetical protein [Bacteroides sp.]
MDDFSDFDTDSGKAILKMKIKAVEQLIRSYTNNKFQNRFIRFEAASESDVLYGASDFLKADDEVEISRSFVNDGLYTVTEITEDGYTRVDQELFTVNVNLVTKIEYPEDVIMGAINLLVWEVNNRDKVGIKAETLSRHSVTYYDQDSNNTVMGYPVSLLGFLRPYMKARF